MHRIGALALFTAAAALTSAAVSSPASAATYLTVGPSSLCGESGCFAGQKKVFTQTFSAAERGSGPIDISSLSLFRSVLGANANKAVKVTFVLADGTEVTWGRWTVGVMRGGETVSIGGEALSWDPTLGDLTVRLELYDPGKDGARGGGGGWGFGGGGGGGDSLGGGGLGPPVLANLPAELPLGGLDLTGPLVRPSLPPQPIIAVPEPGAWALMILGFGAAGAMLRRQRKAYHPGYS